jgi:hypothetical protein
VSGVIRCVDGRAVLRKGSMRSAGGSGREFCCYTRTAKHEAFQVAFTEREYFANSFKLRTASGVRSGGWGFNPPEIPKFLQS